MRLSSLVVGLAGLAVADPTWPSPYDDLEEIMYQLQSFRARKFSDTVTPCSSEASGPGRQNAAEWVRTAFHDMATRNKFFGGGLDGAIQFMLGENGENVGPGFRTTLEFFAPYYNKRTSLADLIAAGVSIAVRSCGGPVVPVRPGRVDAERRAGTGVPQPQNSVQTFRDQFDRMGFTATEMIEVTACGHTLGGVHTENFPDIVPPGSTANGRGDMDSTSAAFDSRIASEFVAGNTTNPLVVGPAVAIDHHADWKVYTSDGNVTITAMAEPETFRDTCKRVLQKMIDLVPPSLTLQEEPVQPYTVKPVGMSLVVHTGGTQLLWTGYIRVRTSEIPVADISSVVVRYVDRTGGCPTSSCNIVLSRQGASQGFDDAFSFYPIQRLLPASSGISSFTVSINMVGGGSLDFDNNGERYPIQDAVLFQQPQSCLLTVGGDFTVTAAVRNDRHSLPTKAVISYKTPRTNSPVPQLNTQELVLGNPRCVGLYTFYSATWNVPGGMASESYVDLVNGEGEDAIEEPFRDVKDVGGTCLTFGAAPACDGGPPPSSSSTMTSSSSTSDVASSTTSSAAPTETLHHRDTIGDYSLLGCWTEATGIRALTGKATAYDEMTLESCMADCAGFTYFGAEYGRECFCGDELQAGSVEAPLSECGMTCAGDDTQYCGDGNRLELYSLGDAPGETTTTTSTAPEETTSTTAAPEETTTSSSPASSTSDAVSSTTSSAGPAATLHHRETVLGWSLVGCWTEGTGARALGAKMYGDDEGMTLESCAAFCDGFSYFGTEYARECFCGNELHETSASAPLAECNMVCTGDDTQYCGDGNRLELYSVNVTPSESTTTTSTSEEPDPSTTTSTASSASTTPEPTTTTTTTTSSSPVTTTSTEAEPSGTTLAHVDSIGEWQFQGCWTEATTGRALDAKAFASADMTLESCADFCAGFVYFATEYASECYCGNALAPSSQEADLADCSMTCSGNPLQYCGAGNRLELYMSDAVVSQPGQPETIGDYNFIGCYVDLVAGRALDGDFVVDPAMTNEMCAAYCDGFQFFGTEYGTECFCGDEIVGGSTEVSATQCIMGCAGNSLQYCGSGSRLSMYEMM